MRYGIKGSAANYCRLGGAACLLLLTGCAYASIQATKDPNFSNPMHKLFIFLNHTQVDQIDPGYTAYLVTALEKGFKQNGLEVVVRSVTVLELNETSYDAEVKSYGPDGVLVILSNGGVVGAYGGMAQINYDVSLYDITPNPKRIWRAQILASGGEGVREQRMNLVVQRLLERLNEDKMISPEPRQNIDGQDKT